MNARRVIWDPPAQAASDLCPEKLVIWCLHFSVPHHRHVLWNVNENYHFLQLF